MSTQSARRGSERYGYGPEPWRTVGRSDLLFLCLARMAPLGPLAIFGAVFGASRGMPALGYLLGAVALVLAATSYGTMAKAFSVSGGVYDYTGRCLGASFGFVAGWMILLDYLLVPTLLYVVAAAAMHAAVPAVPIAVWALVFIAATAAVTLRGVRMTATVTAGVVAAELAVLVLFLGAGVWAVADGKGNGSGFSAFSGFTGAGGFSGSALFAGASVAMFSLLGFEGASTLVEEARGGARAVGRAMKFALLIAGALFVAQAWVAALIVPRPASIAANGDPTAVVFYGAAAVAGGGWLAKTVSVTVAICLGLVGTTLAQVAVSRLLYTMGRDGQLPRVLAGVSLKRSVPVNSTLAVVGVSTVFTLWAVSRAGDGYGEVFLISLVTFGALAAFLLLHVSVIVHHTIRRGSRDRLRHLAVPVVGGALLIAVLADERASAERVGWIWLFSGLLILGVLHATGRRPRLSGIESGAVDVDVDVAVAVAVEESDGGGGDGVGGSADAEAGVDIDAVVGGGA